MSGAMRSILASFSTEFDGKALEKGESQIHGMIGVLKKFGPALVEAFAIKEIGEFAFGLAEQAEQLSLNAKAIGISADELQKWDYAANISGVSAEAMNTGLEKLERSAVKAGKGGSLAFGSIKVSVDKAGGGFKDADELLGDVSEAIANMQDPTEQVGAAMAAFGRSGAKLLPFLKQGRAGIAALKEEVEKLGGGFSEDFIEKSEDMIKNSKRLDFAMISLKTAAIGPLLPIISDLAVGATKVIVTMGKWVKNSQATKTALIALGIGGAAALAPLLLSIAPIVVGFLALEDFVTFLSGGKSLTGDAVNKFFGDGAAAKVQAFASALSADLGPILHDIFAIFTDGKPLDEKFKELDAYIAGTLGPNFRAEFGEMGGDIAKLISAAASLAETLKDIVKAMQWIGSHTVGAIGKAVFAASDATANEDARQDARKKQGNESWFDKARDALNYDYVPKTAPEAARATAPALSAADAKSLVDTLYASAPNVATAPVAGGKATPDVNQTNTTTVNQYFTADTPDAVKSSAANGAKAGVSDGNNLRTKRALVPTG